MCLAIPGKVLQVEIIQGIRIGRVQRGGIVHSARLDFVPEAVAGDFVLVHAGFALSKVEGSEAERTFELLQEIGALEHELASASEESS